MIALRKPGGFSLCRECHPGGSPRAIGRADFRIRHGLLVAVTAQAAGLKSSAFLEKLKENGIGSEILHAAGTIKPRAIRPRKSRLFDGENGGWRKQVSSENGKTAFAAGGDCVRFSQDESTAKTSQHLSGSDHWITSFFELFSIRCRPSFGPSPWSASGTGKEIFRQAEGASPWCSSRTVEKNLALVGKTKVS